MHEPLDRIHDASMTLLETTGIRIHHPDILKKLAQKGIRCEGDTLYFTRQQINKLIASAPATVSLHAPDPKFNMEIGGDNTYYGSGYGCAAIIDREGRQRRPLFDDFKRFMQMVEASPHFHLNGGILVQPSDLPPEHSTPLMIRELLLHSQKCLMGIPGHRDEVERTMEMVAIARGDLSKAHRIITLVNATSPMQFDSIALETMEVCAKYRQPIIISPGPIAGATGPVTLAGNIAMGNAEALAGVAITQLLSKGTPVLYGLQATTADMATGTACVGSPGFALEAEAGIRLAKRYGLPCRSGGAGSDACVSGAQSGAEAMMTLMVSRRERANLMLHSAGILDGYGAMSIDKFITDLEVISMVEYFEKGLDTSEEHLGLAVIDQTAKGSTILAHPHTFKHCRTAPWTPSVSWRGPLKGKTGREVYEDRMDQAIETLLNACPAFESPCRKQLDTFLTSLGVPTDLLDGCETAHQS